MDPNGLPGGIFSGMGSGMLELEMSLQPRPHQTPQQNPQNPNHLQQHQHHRMVSFGHHEADHYPQIQQTVKQGYPFAPKSRSQQLTFSDEDEPGVAAEDSADDGKTKISPWQRMKWTDGMVKLLIMVVFYVGDDQAGSEGNDPCWKKGGSASLVLQKKGKWKSVSMAMMERGFCVSPQQCEDKFNDLNKRYKRVNDILGKGTACRVVENQSLLETMDHLSPKMKEEVKKLLNSKHLFFREMCAYHNSCGGGAQQSAEGAADSSKIQQHSHQKRCLHSAENSPNLHNLTRAEIEGSKLIKGGSGEEEEDGDEEDDNEDDEEVVEGGARSHEHGHDEYDTDDKTSSKKRPRQGMLAWVSPLVQELSTELKNVEQDGTKGAWEKMQWVRMRLMQLEEKRINYQCYAFELEKQRINWLKFSSSKERELEAEKLGNERMRLENERMVLLLRQKELELLGLQHQNQSSSKRGDPSSITVQIT